MFFFFFSPHSWELYPTWSWCSPGAHPVAQEKMSGEILLSIPRLIGQADLPVAEGSVNEWSGHESRMTGRLCCCCLRQSLLRIILIILNPWGCITCNVNSSTRNSLLFPPARFYIQILASCFQVVFRLRCCFLFLFGLQLPFGPHVHVSSRWSHMMASAEVQPGIGHC